MSAPAEPRRLTGRGVLVILVGAFGVIVGVNLALAWFATDSFPGLVVRNSYVASQDFDARRAVVETKGWRTEAGWSDGTLMLRVLDDAGRPVERLAVTVRLGRPASALTDRSLVLERRAGGYRADGYRADVALEPGRWLAAFEIRDGAGEPVELRSVIHVAEGGR